MKTKRNINGSAVRPYGEGVSTRQIALNVLSPRVLRKAGCNAHRKKCGIQLDEVRPYGVKHIEKSAIYSTDKKSRTFEVGVTHIDIQPCASRTKK